MNYSDVEKARVEAIKTLELADNAIRHAADLIKRRLRSSRVRWPVLDELKRELKDYNMRTGKWK